MVNDLHRGPHCQCGSRRRVSAGVVAGSWRLRGLRRVRYPSRDREFRIVERSSELTRRSRSVSTPNAAPISPQNAIQRSSL